MNDGENQHIRDLYRSSKIDFNCLNELLLSQKLKTKELTLTQIEAICKIRYWYYVKVLDEISLI